MIKRFANKWLMIKGEKFIKEKQWLNYSEISNAHMSNVVKYMLLKDPWIYISKESTMEGTNLKEKN